MANDKENMANYPNLRRHRTTLGWSIGELLGKTEKAPSEKSVRRLEAGNAIREVTVNKLFNTIVSQAMFADLDREKEVIVVAR